MSNNDKCFFCGSGCKVNTAPSRHRINQYECPYCGVYLLPKITTLCDVDVNDIKIKFKIACILNEKRLKGFDHIALVNNTDAKEKVDNFNVIPTVDLLKEFPQSATEHINRAILNLSRLSEPYDLIQLNMTSKSDYLLLFKKDQKAAYNFLKELERRKLISFNMVTSGPQLDRFSLTTEAYELIESLQKSKVKKSVKYEIVNSQKVTKKGSIMEYDVFISHASEDKQSFVEPLAQALRQAGIKVWYDRFELKLGDSLREKIDLGLANSRYGVVVLSKAFFSKEWPKTELDSLVTRQNSESKKVVLPIWHEVTKKDVEKFSPILPSKLAAQSSESLETIVDQIENVLNENPSHQKLTGDKKRPAGTGQEKKETFSPPIFTDKPTETDQRNEDTRNEREGYLEPKPPEFLQQILWLLKYGRKHWKIILLAVIILGILFSLKFNLYGKAFNLLTKKTTNYSGRTQLYPRTKKRVDDFYESIRNEKLDPWLFINVEGVESQVTKYNGDVIIISGAFMGSKRLIFWSDDFIPFFIEDAIIKVFDQTIEECRKNNLDPEVYIYEAKGILSNFIYKIYNHMASMDQKLLKQAYPESSGRRDVTSEIEKMSKCLDEQYNAALLLASGKENAK